MIRKIYILLPLLIIAALLNAAVYEYEITIPEPVFKQSEGHLLVDIPGCMQVGTEGEPLRPHYPVSYILPPGETIENIELTIERSETLPLMLPLLPKQSDRPLSWGNSSKGFIKNETVYKLEKYPSDKLRTGVQWYRGAGMVMGTIDPTEYYPASGTLELARSMKIKITTKPENKDIHLRESDKVLLADIGQNPELLSQYSFAQDQSKHCLIITSNQLKNTFRLLKTHYLKYGIITDVITTADIQLEGVPGRDMPEMIRNKILNVYLTQGLDYVILGGNSDQVPYRGLSCRVFTGGVWESSNDIPGDLYYAALDGTWDRNENNIFGEYNDSTGYDEADLLPELAIGRLPVANEIELQNMVMKSIRYQRGPVVNDLDRHSFFGEFLYPDPESWAADYMELLIGTQSENGYTTRGIPSYVTIDKWYDQDSSNYWDQTTVKNELANGTSFLHHDGHSNYTYMMKFYTSQINDSDFVTVNGIDHTTPIFYSHGCNCGGFDRSNCIASRFVTSPYITVGGVFNSRFGWFNEGQTEGPSIHLHREFENAIYGLNFDHFGWALSVSKIKTASWVTAPNQFEQNALRWNYYTQNILGDPVMRIFSDKPAIPAITYDLSQLGTGVLKASVMTESDPIEDAGLAVQDSMGELLAYGETDANGNIEINISQPLEAGDVLHCYINGENIMFADTILTVPGSSVNRPVSFAMLSNYPNPFNPSTTIRYSIPLDMDVKIELYDLNGKLMRVLLDAPRQAGSYEFKLDGQDLASAMYICRMRADDTILNRKLLLIK